MISNNISEREGNRISSIANEYRKNGYQVFIQPSFEDLPNFLLNYQPDILAVGANESVVIEVKSSADLSEKSHLSKIAEIIEAQPGWRFELVITNPKGKTLISLESRLPNIDLLRSWLLQAKQLVANGRYEAAIIIAWSAAEGLLRLIGEDEKIILDRRSSSYVIKKLFSLGLLNNDLYEQLNATIKMRNSVVHGFIEPNLNADMILNFIKTIRKNITKYRKKKSS